MRRTAKIAWVVAAGVLVLAVGIPAGAATYSLSPKEFRATANNICPQGRQLREELVHQHFGNLAAGEEPSVEQLTADPTLLSGDANPFAAVTMRARALGLRECAE